MNMMANVRLLKATSLAGQFSTIGSMAYRAIKAVGQFLYLVNERNTYHLHHCLES